MTFLLAILQFPVSIEKMTKPGSYEELVDYRVPHCLIVSAPSSLALIGSTTT
jgi:hypothetical protein